MKRDLSMHDVFVAQVRATQAMFPVEHRALLNWGSWSRDRKQIGPRLARQHLLDAHDGDTEGYGDEPIKLPEAVCEKAERPQETYDEKSAGILDERIHGPGGLALQHRQLLRIAYVYPPPEYQMPRFCNCPEDEFRYRLECILKFVRRFV